MVSLIVIAASDVGNDVAPWFVATTSTSLKKTARENERASVADAPDSKMRRKTNRGPSFDGFIPSAMANDSAGCDPGYDAEGEVDLDCSGSRTPLAVWSPPRGCAGGGGGGGRKKRGPPPPGPPAPPKKKIKWGRCDFSIGEPLRPNHPSRLCSPAHPQWGGVFLPLSFSSHRRAAETSVSYSKFVPENR